MYFKESTDLNSNFYVSLEKNVYVSRQVHILTVGVIS